MCNSIIHRGPDDEGYFFDDKIALGMRRLSIIDLEGGHQPIHNETKDLWIVFNGEIYNFQELKADLHKKGHRFYSKSDTEVIIHLYEEYKEKCLHKLNGMFAFAIWDAKEQKLFAARDRLGKKPFYYSDKENDFVFGSEIKSLLAHPRVSRDLSLDSLNRYLTYEYVPGPHTIFKDISKLNPGHYLVKKNNNLEIKQYWDVNFDEPLDFQQKELISKLDQKLQDAVSKRLMSDVPLGIFLSGGLDSSTIAHYMVKSSKDKVKSFSIGFKESSFDESEYAKLAASHLGTEHYQKILEAKDMVELVPSIADMLDEPLADSSIIPTYLLSKFTKSKVTVALGGDGGDEIFMGYPIHQAHKIAKFYEAVPQTIRKKIIQPLISKLPTSFDDLSFDFKLKKFTEAFDHPKEIRHQVWLGAYNEELKKKLLLPEVYDSTSRNFLLADLAQFGQLERFSYWEKIIYIYIKQYLLEDILVKVDRASMFASLEVRTPFLDYELIDFVNRIPPEKKLKRLRTKYLLKELMYGKLPKEIIDRSKKGFSVPISQWLRSDLKPLTESLLGQKRIKSQGLFDYGFIKKLLEEHNSGKKDNRKYIWTLIIFQLWYDRWLQ